MNRLLLLLGLAGLLLAAGCRKDDEVDCAPAPTPTSNVSLEEFTRRNGVPVQTFTVLLGPNNAIQAVTTSAGARITFPASSFILPNGTTAATGPGQVRVREIYSVADMALSNMPTVRGGSRKLLISGGEFSIQVWQNGTRLRLAPGMARVAVQSPVPAGAGSGRQFLWLQPTARLTGDSAGWIPATPPNVPAGFPAPSDSIRVTGAPPVYQTSIPLDSVSWWNLDRVWQLYQTAPVGTVTVQFPAIAAGSSGSTRIFLRPVGSNGLISPYINSMQASWSGQLPTGAAMIAAILQSVNGQLYYGSQAFTTQTSITVTPALTPVSEADAVRLIKQL